MTIAAVLLKLLEDIQFSDEIRLKLKEVIDSAIEVTSNPRDEIDGNQKLLHATLIIAFEKTQELYGESGAKDLHHMPVFLNQSQSQIVWEKDNPDKSILGIGNCARSWEEVFYDICHESLHLLNPATNVIDDDTYVSALEEGCAVKFAEQMYDRYIKPTCDKIPLTSPTRAPSSQYFLAYSAARKIPDDVLKVVRSVFGKFSNINDCKKFSELVDKYVSDIEINELIKPFSYKRKK